MSREAEVSNGDSAAVDSKGSWAYLARLATETQQHAASLERSPRRSEQAGHEVKALRRVATAIRAFLSEVQGAGLPEHPPLAVGAQLDELRFQLELARDESQYRVAPGGRISPAGDLAPVIVDLRRAFQRLLERLSEWAEGLPDDDAFRRALPIVERYAERAAVQAAAAETEGARDEALSALDHVRQAAGEVATTYLGQHFGDYAAHERNQANRMRSVTAIIVIAISLVAIALLLDSERKILGDASYVSKLAVTLPLAALAAYFGRESSRHRNAAKWAGELEIQLRTVDAYLEPVRNQALKDEIRIALGRRAFASEADVDRARGADAPSIAAEFSAVADGLATRIRNPSQAAEAESPPRRSGGMENER